MKMLFNWLAAICAFGAAVFWYKSASTTLPDPPAGAFAEAIMPALEAYQKAARRVAESNRWAAALSCAAAVFAAIGLLFP